MIKHLFKQSSIYFSGLLLGKILTTLTFILLARQLLPAGFGEFSLLVTLVQVITFFADFGLIQWYMKDVENHDSKELFAKIISARTFTLIISFILSAIFLYVSNSFDFNIAILFLASLVPEAYLSVVDGYFLAHGQSRRVSLKNISRSLVLLLGYFIYFHNFSFYYAVIWSFLGSLITAAWYVPWNMMEIGKLNLGEIIKTLKKSSSYGFLVITSFGYSRGDSLVIGYLRGDAALGIYSTAYRYLETLNLLPTALAHNLFPISAKKAGVQIQHLLKITGIVGIVGVITAVVLFLSAELLTTTLVGKEYAAAIPIIQIFSLVVVLFFINSPLSTVVQSSKYVKQFLPFGFINTVANIVLNLLLVPQFGIIAAAWVMLATEISGFLINIYFVSKIYTRN